MTHITATRLSMLSFALSAAALTVSLASGCHSRPDQTADSNEQRAAQPTSKPPKIPNETGTTAAPTPSPDETPGQRDPDPMSDEASGRVVTTAKDPGPEGASAGKDTERLSDGLTIKRLVVTNAVDDREPVAVDALEVGQPVFAFVELANGSSETSSVVITFERPGTSVGHVELEIPGDSSRWRTWGKTALIRKTGSWSAVVRTKDGRELARQPFDVEDA